MTPKEIATHYGAKLFDTPDAATQAGFVLTESMRRETSGTKRAHLNLCCWDCATKKKR
jgi:hypothetical protein